MMVQYTLAAHPCFKTLDPDSCRALDSRCAWLETPAGSRVVGQAANDRDVYFVITGRLRAAHHGVRQDLVFTDIEAGSFFGELSALEGAPPSLGVFAVNDSTVAKMPSAIFVETVFTHRPLGEAVVATLVARNRVMTRKVGEAAHFRASRPPNVGSTQSRLQESRFDVAADVRHISEPNSRARRWS
jgi:CRP/FNR family transcriptional regulator, cyclic AMP receptor protein